jgi:riboflavin kinase/FMN adenylyltransferase
MGCLLFRGIESFKSEVSGRLVVTIGNFDGMHLGHRAIFREVNALAADNNASSVLVSFYPHPRYYFARARGESVDTSLLSPPRQKVARAEELGLDALVLIRFSKQLSALSPEEFLKKHVLALGDVKAIVVGRDWHFGKDRAGNAATLKEFGEREGFAVNVVSDESISGKRVSSSGIRQMLKDGDVAHAAENLGYAYTLCGRVQHGDQRGRQLGFPTMNLSFRDELLPAFGVYRTSTLVRGKLLPSISNVGTRPTFSGAKALVETHILEGFSGENYGERVEVRFYERIRPEQRFSGIDELRTQIGKDISIARKGHVGS